MYLVKKSQKDLFSVILNVERLCQMNLAEYVEVAKRVRKNAINKKSRTGNHYSMIRWIQWLYIHQRYLITPQCMGRLVINNGIPTRHRGQLRWLSVVSLLRKSSSK